MTSLATFFWGMGGAAVGYVAVNVLPILAAKAQGKPVAVRWFWLFVHIIAYVLAGGFLAAAMVGGATEIKHAVAYGMAWDTIVKGAAEGLPLADKAVKRYKR